MVGGFPVLELIDLHHFIFQDLILFKIIFQNGNEVRRKFIDITDMVNRRVL